MMGFEKAFLCVLLLLSAAILPGCASSGPKPAPVEPDRADAFQRQFNTLDDKDYFGDTSEVADKLFLAHCHYILERAHQESLWRTRQSNSTMECRMVVIPSAVGDSPYCVRLYWSYERPWIAKYTFSDFRTNSYYSPLYRDTLPFGYLNTRNIENKVNQISFFKMPSEDATRKPLSDEKRYFLEVAYKGEYHWVVRGEVENAESEPFLNLCREFSAMVAEERQ